MLKELDIISNKMPPSEFIKVPTNSRMATTFIDNQPIALTTSWQWILAKISEALIVSDSKGVFKLLFSDLDYVKLNSNTVEDIRSLVRQSVDENALSNLKHYQH